MSKEENDNLARQIYYEIKRDIAPDVVDVIDQRKISPEKIKADMALFRKKNVEKNITLTYYYNRIEIRAGNHLDVLPLNTSIGR